jgi:hypothetical protein
MQSNGFHAALMAVKCVLHVVVSWVVCLKLVFALYLALNDIDFINNHVHKCLYFFII